MNDRELAEWLQRIERKCNDKGHFLIIILLIIILIRVCGK